MTGSWMDLTNHRLHVRKPAKEDELNGEARQQLQTTKRTHSQGRAERREPRTAGTLHEHHSSNDSEAGSGYSGCSHDTQHPQARGTMSKGEARAGPEPAAPARTWNTDQGQGEGQEAQDRRTAYEGSQEQKAR